MKRRLAAAVLASTFGAIPAAAQNVPVQNVLLRNSFNPFGAGARGLGMGGAFIAVADDGTASSFNPAGLAHLRSSELALVGFYDRLDSTIDAPRLDGSSSQRENTSRHGALDFAGLAVPFALGSRHLTVQLSYQRAVDLFGEGRTDSTAFLRAGDVFSEAELAALRLTADRIVTLSSTLEPRQRGALHTANLALGYQLSSRLSVGASVNYWIGEWTASGRTSGTLGIPQQAPRPGQPGTASVEIGGFEQDFEQVHQMRGFNVNLGFLLKYRRVSLGGVMRMPFTSDYDLVDSGQRQDFLGQQPLGPPTATGVSMTGDLEWPRSTGLGLAIRPFSTLTLTGEVSAYQWSRTVLRGVPDGSLLTEPAADDADPAFTDRSFFDLFPAALTSTSNTFQWRAGGEYLVSLPKLVVPLRGGVFRDRSPVVLNPAEEEGRRIEGWTVGTGLNFSHLVFDVAFERRTTSGLIGYLVRPGRGSVEIDTNLSPTEDVQEDRLVASVIYRPGSDQDPLKKLFRFLFLGDEEK